MPEYDMSRVIPAPVEAVWAVVSDPGRLPRWVPTAAASAPVGDTEVRLEGESHGHPYSVTAPFRIEDERRRLSWSGDGSGYHGWLQVRGHEDDCEVSLHIVIPADQPGADADEEIARGLTETLDRVAELAVRP
jgi:uncharacterized protein YndB with AHSA1/START domain